MNINKNSFVNVKDRANILDACTLGGPKRTKIIARDHESGKIIGVFENKVLVPGSQATACRQFGLEEVVHFPTYNTDLGLEKSRDPYPATQPMNTPITCLWCAGRSGAGSSVNEINVVSNTDRISPELETGSTNVYKDILPFRYTTADNDLDFDDRHIYFGRKVFNEGLSSQRNAYFFKGFDTQPMLHVRYLDGTEVTDRMWQVTTTQQVEVYVEMKLSVSRLDFREYFDEVLGWSNANFSTISLLTAWYDNTIPENPSDPPEERIYYKWYQDVIPFSKFNFDQNKLRDLNKGVDFTYQVYY